MCAGCEKGKVNKALHKLNAEQGFERSLSLLHIDLCGPMRIQSLVGKTYVLVIVDYYSRYTWVHFLRTKDEASAIIISFIKNIQVRLQFDVQIVRTNNGTEFKNT